jgi:hypothetical protein
MVADDDDYPYYPVQWLDEPYEVEADSEIEEGGDAMRVRKGEWVCRARYFDLVPYARQWYTPSNGTCLVRLSTAIAVDIAMLPVSGNNPIRGNLSSEKKKEAEEKGALFIPDEDHDEMMNELTFREEMDFEDIEEYDEDGDGEEGHNSDEDDDEDIDVSDDEDDDLEEEEDE